jgi:hypothetical protein
MQRIPQYPICENPKIKRKMSMFAILSHKKENTDELPSHNESEMEKVMSMLAREAHNID